MSEIREDIITSQATKFVECLDLMESRNGRCVAQGDMGARYILTWTYKPAEEGNRQGPPNEEALVQVKEILAALRAMGRT